MARPKLKNTADRNKFILKQTNATEPTIAAETYSTDIMVYLNHHNALTDIKVIRKWALKYVVKHPKQFRALSKATDFELRTIGLLAHVKAKGFFLSEKHEEMLLRKVSALVKKYGNVTLADTPVVEKPVVNIDERIASVAGQHLCEVEGAIDEFLLEGKPFSMKGYLESHNVSGPVAKKIAAALAPRIAELKEALEGKDPELKEGYSNFGKVKLKRFLAFVEQIAGDCDQQVVNTKAARKPRARKAKPPAVIVAKLKYLREFPELKLTSEKPTEIVGASEVWLYDTEKRKLQVYYAADGERLTVKGTTILNYDVKTSVAKTLRKPEVVLKGNLTKKGLNTAFKAIKTKPQALNGRTNERLIILKVF